MVGARAASPNATALTMSICKDLAEAGVVVVSGGALGIDAAAHRGALAGGGATWAVFGCGIDVVYPPQHADLFEQIEAQGGALISSFALGTVPRQGTFVARNAVIAGLADAVIVVEASDRSGALHTARAASRLCRYVGAVAGSTGCDRLLVDGASLVESATDVLQLLGGQHRFLGAAPVDEAAQALLAFVPQTNPIDFDDLVRQSGVAPSQTRRMLTELELAGLAVVGPGPWVRRTALTLPITPCS